MSILRRELQPEGRPPSLRFRPPSIHIPLWLMAAGWLVALAWRGLRWLARHPRSTVLVALVVWLVLADLVLPATGVLAVAGVAMGAWWVLDGDGFTRWVTAPLQLWGREWLVYRREWQPAMLTAGLSLREAWGGDLPVLRTVRDEDGRDVLRVRMLPGQTLEAWQAAAPKLAQTFGVRSVRVRRAAHHQELLLTVARKGGGLRHVTDRTPAPEVQELPAPRGAFPRAPRGGAA